MIENSKSIKGVGKRFPSIPGLGFFKGPSVTVQGGEATVLRAFLGSPRSEVECANLNLGSTTYRVNLEMLVNLSGPQFVNL